jgi:hypothetical protein
MTISPKTPLRLRESGILETKSNKQNSKPLEEVESEPWSAMVHSIW